MESEPKVEFTQFEPQFMNKRQTQTDADPKKCIHFVKRVKLKMLENNKIRKKVKKTINTR